jgi:pantoate--beta-alanine ligase
MSSRNLRLTEEERAKAPAIYRALSVVKEGLESGKAGFKLVDKAELILEEAGFRIDYVKIADARTLGPVAAENAPLVVLAAAFLGEIRLIDNMIL